MKETTHTHYHAHFMSPAHTHEHDHLYLLHRHQHYEPLRPFDVQPCCGKHTFKNRHEGWCDTGFQQRLAEHRAR